MVDCIALKKKKEKKRKARSKLEKPLYSRMSESSRLTDTSQLSDPQSQRNSIESDFYSEQSKTVTKYNNKKKKNNKIK